MPMANVWESGAESSVLDDIVAGKKTIEGRLNRGKFAKYVPGDIITLRRDYRDADGMLHDGPPGQATVKVTAVRQYRSFLDMVKGEGFEKVIPSAKSAAEAAALYGTFYSVEDQEKYGVLAIGYEVVRPR